MWSTHLYTMAYRLTTANHTTIIAWSYLLHVHVLSYQAHSWVVGTSINVQGHVLVTACISHQLEDPLEHCAVVAAEQCRSVLLSWLSKEVTGLAVACEQERVFWETLLHNDWMAAVGRGSRATTTLSLWHKLAGAGKSNPHRKPHCCAKHITKSVDEIHTLSGAYQW